MSSIQILEHRKRLLKQQLLQLEERETALDDVLTKKRKMKRRMERERNRQQLPSSMMSNDMHIQKRERFSKQEGSLLHSMKGKKAFDRSSPSSFSSTSLSIPRPFHPTSQVLIKNRQRKVYEEGTKIIDETVRRKEREEKRKVSKQVREQLRSQLIPKQQPNAPSVRLPPSLFPGRYERGELPCTIEHGGAFNRLTWVCPLEHLDYSYYLPLFFDGLRLTENPPAFIGFLFLSSFSFFFIFFNISLFSFP